MSGPVRSKIPNWLRSIKKNIEISNKNFDNNEYEYDKHDIKDCTRVFELTKNEIKKLEIAYDNLLNLDKKWKDFIKTLEGEEKAAERKIRDIYIQKHNFTKIMEEAAETIDLLKAINLEVKKFIKKSDQSQPHPSEQDSEGEDRASDEEEIEEEDLKESDERSNETRSSDLRTSDNQTSIVYNRKLKINLPPQNLTHFNGTYSNWLPFWDDFKSSVHDDQYLENIQKFKYLKGILHEEPYRIISPYPLTNQNYPIVIELLRKRYGNNAILRENLHNELRNLRKSTESISDLRKLIILVNRIILQLKTFGEDINHPQIKQSIETKLPNSLRIKLREQFGTFSTQKLMQFLDNHTQAREEIEKIEDFNRDKFSPPRPAFPHRKPNYKFSPNTTTWRYPANNRNFDNRYQYRNSSNFNQQFQTSALTTQVKPLKNFKPYNPRNNGANEIKFKFCNFCEKNNHYSKECKSFPDVETRNVRRRELKLCLNCLKKGHDVKECQSKYSCYHCQGKHNSLLCMKRSTNYSNGSKPTTSRTSTNVIKEDVIHTKTFINREDNPKQEVEEILITIEAPVSNLNENNEYTSVILFDNGSQKSYITNEFADKLCLTTLHHKTLAISTFNQTDSKIVQSRVVQLGVKTTKGGIEIITLQTIEKITDIATVHLQKSINADGRKIVVGMKNPHILIGIDHYWQFMLPETKIKLLSSGFYRISTKIGDICSGKGIVEVTKTNLIGIKKQEKEDLNKTIQHFWNLESIGILDSPTLSDEDAAILHFNKTVKFEQNRYIVRWPFKQEYPQFPTNYGLCIGRLRGVIKQLIKNKNLQKYDDILEDQLASKVNEIVPFESNQLTHYLPHHPVIKESSATTKIRPVYDASAKLKGNSSLNEEIYSGPKKIPDLCGMLLRFRLKKYVLISDIEKAFLQVSLNELDRDTTRFLWLKKEALNELSNKPREVEMKDLEIRRFNRIPFGVNASPFLLASVIELHLTKIDEMFENFKNMQTESELNLSNKKPKFEQLCKELAENAYVDNFVMMCEDKEDIKFKHFWSKTIFQFASMNLREYVSNHEESNTEIQRIEGNELPKLTKLLGIKWNVVEDELKLKLDIPPILKGTTKRQVIQLIAKNFDPMGWISPLILPHKRFFQSLWKSKRDWDEELNKNEIAEWNNISYSGEITLPRFPYNETLNKPVELHIFSDASGTAYGTTAYLKLIESNEIHLIFAKTRLAPLKELTIPKLELLALLIGTRITKFVIKETKLQIQNIYMWSDSKCVLSWLKYKKDLPTFVKNRINEIKLTAKAHDLKFHYIQSLDNPADIASKGMTSSELINSSLWWHGPSWLKLPFEQWPSKQLEEFTPENIEENYEEELNDTQVNLTKTEIKPFIHWNNFSSWKKLVNYFKVLLKFTVFAFSGKSEKFDRKFKFKNPLTLNDEFFYQLAAEKILVRYIQTEIPPTDQEKRQLGIYVNSENISVCGGRLKNAAIKGIHPIFLPKAI